MFWVNYLIVNFQPDESIQRNPPGISWKSPGNLFSQICRHPALVRVIRHNVVCVDCFQWLVVFIILCFLFLSPVWATWDAVVAASDRERCIIMLCISGTSTDRCQLHGQTLSVICFACRLSSANVKPKIRWACTWVVLDEDRAAPYFSIRLYRRHYPLVIKSNVKKIGSWPMFWIYSRCHHLTTNWNVPTGLAVITATTQLRQYLHLGVFVTRRRVGSVYIVKRWDLVNHSFNSL